MSLRRVFFVGQLTRPSDVISLVVALYTIKLATSPSSAANSYGWQRAEILGALINGVFLVALCFSIALEALGRMISPPEISNPKVIVIVGGLGLLSNVVGLFLFHGQCEFHQVHKSFATHSHTKEVSEHGHSHSHSHGAVALPDGPVEGDSSDPQTGRPRADSMSSFYQHPAQARAQVIETAQEFGYGRSTDDSGFMGAMSPPSGHHHLRTNSNTRRSNKRESLSRPRPVARMSSGPAKIPPAPGVNEVHSPHVAQSASSNTSTTTAVADTPSTKAVEHEHEHSGHDHQHLAKDSNDAEQGKAHDHSHENQGHSHEGEEHGHDHGSMNMRGVFLHVLGDA